MANPNKGEVAIIIGDRTFTLRLSINAIAELEDAMGMGINKISAQLSDTKDVRVKDWRLVLWAALRDRHPEVDVKAAGELLGEAGLDSTINALGEAMRLAFPEKKDGGRPSPAAGQDGTGQSS